MSSEMWWEIKHLLIAYFLTSTPAKMIKTDSRMSKLKHAITVNF